jgi:hypothetical protein
MDWDGCINAMYDDYSFFGFAARWPQVYLAELKVTVCASYSKGKFITHHWPFRATLACIIHKLNESGDSSFSPK